MRFHILTLFPEMVEQGLNTSILKRATDKGLIEIDAIDIRDYSKDRHKKVDDYPYGGGAGMLMQPEPVYNAYTDLLGKIGKERMRVLFMTPQGKPFTQRMAEELAKEEDLVFLCGHYEGIDERVIEEIVSDEVSLGDFVLTGGELPAMVMTDCISRLIPGVLGSDESASDESFSDGLLEYAQYTRPEEWKGRRVPDVLLSGNHKDIEIWRTASALERTKEKRPEMYGAVHEELEEYKKNNPNKFRKPKSEAENLIKMRMNKSSDRKNEN